MMAFVDLRQAERRAFRTAYDDGLWDVMLAGIVAMLAIGPLLSTELGLGDFWSSAAFIPVWLGGYLVIRLVRRRLLIPRVGEIRVAEDRRRRLRTASLILLAVNLVAFGGGLAFWILGPAAGWAVPIVLGLTVLLICSVMGYSFDMPRLYLYGFMLAVAPLVGEWLWREGYAAHHGWPVTFGLAAVLIAAFGIVRFARVLAGTRRVAAEDRAESV
jgi:hypothetical protein